MNFHELRIIEKVSMLLFKVFVKAKQSQDPYYPAYTASFRIEMCGPEIWIDSG